MISCKDFVINRKLELKEKVKELATEYRKRPELCIIQIGSNSASNSYVLGKIKDCNDILINHYHYHIDDYSNLSQEDLINKIKKLNDDPYTSGIIIQLPIPDKYDINELIKHISPEKDVDGFRRDSCFKSCTPKGIMDWLKYNNYNLRGKFVTVIGRSDIVGKPLVNMMIEEQATVLNCNSKSSNADLAIAFTHSDIVVSAIGVPLHFGREKLFNMKTPDIIIDVGINRDCNGKLCGDINRDEINKYFPDIYITPVPGGVGLMTRLALIENTVEAFILQHQLK